MHLLWRHLHVDKAWWRLSSISALAAGRAAALSRLRASCSMGSDIHHLAVADTTAAQYFASQPLEYPWFNRLAAFGIVIEQGLYLIVNRPRKASSGSLLQRCQFQAAGRSTVNQYNVFIQSAAFFTKSPSGSVLASFRPLASRPRLSVNGTSWPDARLTNSILYLAWSCIQYQPDVYSSVFGSYTCSQRRKSAEQAVCDCA